MFALFGIAIFCDGILTVGLLTAFDDNFEEKGKLFFLFERISNYKFCSYIIFSYLDYLCKYCYRKTRPHMGFL